MPFDSGPDFIRDTLLAGIDAARPQVVVDRQITVEDDRLCVQSVDGSVLRYDLDEYDRIRILGGGNAAGALASAVESTLVGASVDGLVVTDAPHDDSKVNQRCGDHPLPTDRNRRHTEELLEIADQADSNDLILATITGGGSALLAAPATGIELADLQGLTDQLLAAGAPIDAINVVRKHCSRIKGGWLADRLAPADVLGICISDVVGDDPSTIASGPLVPDTTTYEQARSILDRYNIAIPESIEQHLRAGVRGDQPETPATPFEHVQIAIVANNRTAIEGAATTLEDSDIDSWTLSSCVRGAAQSAGTVHAAVAAEIEATGAPVEPPVALFSGGETTVTIDDKAGIGGPNQEFVLAAALEYSDLTAGSTTITIGAVDTDGIDGPTDNAGAVIDSAVVEAPRAREALTAHDVTPVLEDWECQITTGPTGTNVNDLRVMFIDGQ